MDTARGRYLVVNEETDGDCTCSSVLFCGSRSECESFVREAKRRPGVRKDGSGGVIVVDNIINHIQKLEIVRNTFND